MRRVVITGMGLVTPLANGREASWKKLIAGESGLKTVDLFDTSDLACKIGGQVPWTTGRGGGSADDQRARPRGLRPQQGAAKSAGSLRDDPLWAVLPTRTAPR